MSAVSELQMGKDGDNSDGVETVDSCVSLLSLPFVTPV